LLARASLSYARPQIHDHMPSCIETVIINKMCWFCFCQKRIFIFFCNL